MKLLLGLLLSFCIILIVVSCSNNINNMTNEDIIENNKVRPAAFAGQFYPGYLWPLFIPEGGG